MSPPLKEGVVNKGALLAGVHLTTTGMPAEEKGHIARIVTECGGSYHDDYDPNIITHLVARSVGSEKYRAAVVSRVYVVTEDWVDAIWEHKDIVSPGNYMLPPFAGLTVCCTGLSADVREEIRAVVEANGGEYSGMLELNITTHLLAEVPEGAKFEAAIGWGRDALAVVTPKWLYKSVERGACLDEDEFLLIPEGHDNDDGPLEVEEEAGGGYMEQEEGEGEKEGACADPFHRNYELQDPIQTGLTTYPDCEGEKLGSRPPSLPPPPPPPPSVTGTP